MFFADEPVCEEFFTCDNTMPMFEGCRNHCMMKDFFDDNGMEFRCEECHDEYHHREYHNGGHLCSRHDSENDCSEDSSIGRPTGPEGCKHCYVIGDENLCSECNHDDGYEMDWMSRTCFIRQHASDERWPVDCPDTMEGCAICEAGEKVNHENEIVHYTDCMVCRVGWFKSNWNQCVHQDQDWTECSTATEHLDMELMERCMPGMCADFGDRGQACFECDLSRGFDRHDNEDRYHAHCMELGMNHCWTEDMRNNGELSFILPGEHCTD